MANSSSLAAPPRRVSHSLVTVPLSLYAGGNLSNQGMENVMRLLAVLAALLTANCLLAAPLADRVPADAIVYVGWQGATAAKPAYDGSLLKQFVDGGDLAQAPQYLDRLLTRISKENAGVAELSRTLRPVLGTIWDSPVALYMGPAAGGNDVCTALIIDAGSTAADTSAKLQQALAKQPPGGPLAVKTAGQIVVLGANVDDALLSRLAAPAAAGDSLASDANFTAAAKKVSGDAALTVYLNIDAFRMQLDRRNHGDWPAVRDALQLQGLHYFISACGFDGRQWNTQMFLAAPAPRQGLATLFDAQPLSDELLRVIPRSASLVITCQFDLARSIKEVRSILARTDSQAAAKFNQALGAARLTTSVDLENGLGAALGSQWALYAAPNIGGNRALGWVIANRLRDPAAAERAMTAMENALTNLASAGLRGNKMQLRAYRVSRGDINVHYLGLAAVSPAWTIRDGTLYMALYPQVALAAAESAAAGTPSLLDSPLLAGAGKLAGAKPAGISFVDLPATCADGYGTALLLSRYLLGLSDMFGAQSPAMIIPPLNKLQPIMQPSLAASWTDESGWYSHGNEPFPCSILLSGDVSLVSGMSQGFLAAVVLPQFTGAGDQARMNAVLSTTQTLRSQFELYKLNHADAYPDFEVYPRWEQLLQRTDEEGVPTPNGRYGPYLQSAPANALNGYSGVEVLNAAPAAGYKSSRPGIGWIFVKDSGRLYPTDHNGAIMMLR